MNILYVSQYFTTPEQPGSLRHYANVQYLASRGHHVTVVTSLKPPEKAGPGSSLGSRQSLREENDGIVVWRVRVAPRKGGVRGRLLNYSSFALRAMVLARRIKEPVDVVLASSPPLLAGAAGAWIATRRRVPFVAEIRDLWPKSAVALGFLSHPIAIWLARKLERWVYRRSEAVVAVTEGIAEGVRSVAPTVPISVVHNGVDENLFPSLDNGTRLSNTLEMENGFVVGYAGAHGINNALDSLIDAATLLRDEPVLFDVIGYGDQTDRLLERCMVSGLKSVRFLGSIARCDIPRLLARMDAFVWPVLIRAEDPCLIEIKRGAVPNKLFDYLALGKPIITSIPEDGEAARMIRSYGQGVFVEPTGEGLAQGIRAVMTEEPDPELRSKAAAFRREYSRGVQAEQLNSILANILPRRPRWFALRTKRTQLVAKRTLDILIAGMSLPLLAMPFAIIAVAIKLDSRGPVFFYQERVGKDGRSFRVLKLRTMVEGAEAMGTGIKTSPADFRITRVGRWLRLFGLDELPQILNVLKGEMSLVGPRPTIPAQVVTYSPYQRQRLTVKPGVTGLAVIRGRNALTWEQRIEWDVEYVTHWSLWMDVKILALTPWCVLIKRRGVYRPTEVGRN